ncbi:glycoside hydrolase family 43 protein [Flexithrix dorotheae]|uniref:glycoside hydrolase family 43 protein n=1 Tax=Flexithrix dorotheae TaxID=70993 RepID=UPI000362776B|nr:glycoside hydrolase family 43 protein [Flexithrix dorotheae]
MQKRIKNYLLLILLITSGFCAYGQEKEIFLFSFFKGNGEDGLHLAASEDGYNWKALNHNESLLTPLVGGDKLMRDPCIIRGADGKFHMVWTVSWNEKGIGYANSEDLINWSEQQYIPVMEHESGARNCWAPELFYDEASAQYMIYWATTIPGRFPETDSLGDTKYNHRMYYTLTKDFKEFTKAALLYEKGFNVIDATIVKEGSNYIMFLKNETLSPKPEKNIRIATSRYFNQNYSEASTAISPDWVEGPTVTKVGGNWVVYFDKYTKHRMGAITSSDLKNWEEITEKIHFPEGTRHGTVFKVKKKEYKKLLKQLGDK